jgi:hypothetical protein
MNFRTTLVLVILLAAAAVAVFVTRDHRAKSDEQVAEAPKAAKLLDVDSASVTKLSITPASDPAVVMERSGVDWRLTAPVNAPADAATASTVVDALANLQSRGDVDAASAASSGTGLDHPRFKVELTTKDGKASTLNFGERAATGAAFTCSEKATSQCRSWMPAFSSNSTSPPPTSAARNCSMSPHPWFNNSRSAKANRRP